MKAPLVQLVFRWSVLALGVTLAAKVIPGIHFDGLQTLLVVVVLLSLFNAVLKPLLVLFALPFIFLTLGFGMLLINAFLFLFAGRIVDGFYVESFWSALGGSLIVSLTNLVLSRALSNRRGPPSAPRTPPRGRSAGQDVIDI